MMKNVCHTEQRPGIVQGTSHKLSFPVPQVRGSEQRNAGIMEIRRIITEEKNEEQRKLYEVQSTPY